LTPRMAAVLSLNSCFRNNKFANIELDSAIKKYGFVELDKSFYTRLLYGTIERKITLDYLIACFSSVKPEKIEPLVFCILRTGLYQILYMDKVPDNAAVNEAVELCKALCPTAYAGYVNAVLRNLIRHKADIPELLRKDGGLKSISLQYSIPLWILELWTQDYGKERATALAKYFCEREPFLTLRINTGKVKSEEFKENLGYDSVYGKFTQSVLKLGGSFPAEDLYGYADGLFFVQDEASCLAASLLGPDQITTENPVILDVCACPGGKSFSVALNFGDKARIHSFDLHENRLKLIEKGAARLGLTSITTYARDARIPNEAFFGTADAVICDVPCSGLGVIAKKPDIKFKKYEEIEKLPVVQYEIVKASALSLKSGGSLIYSTCTLRRAENEEIVEKFIKENEGYELSSTNLLNETDSGMVTFFPDLYDTDGFFVAKIKKK